METKICSKCKEEKFVYEFNKHIKKKDGLRTECMICSRLSNKLYREKNNEKEKNRIQFYKKNNSEKVKISNQKYLNNNSEKRKETIRNHYINNIEKIKERYKILKENNHNKLKEIKNKSYHKNKKKHKERIKEYRKTNKNSRADYQKKLLKTNVIYKVSSLCRTRIYHFLKVKNLTKKHKTFEIIGCTPQFLKEYLEQKFIEGMSWDLMGKHIHIDHIIPLSSANTEEEVYKLCHYTNLQPLWAEDNLKKGFKIV